MRKILLFSLLSLFTCCSTLRDIETIQREVVTYRDSTIIHTDTIYTKIPVESYYDYTDLLDTLHLETSVAVAEAYLDTSAMMLKGDIFNKAVEIPTEYIWKERIVEKTDTLYLEKTINTETVKYKRDSLFWALVSYLILSLMAIALWIYLKLR